MYVNHKWFRWRRKSSDLQFGNLILGILGIKRSYRIPHFTSTVTGVRENNDDGEENMRESQHYFMLCSSMFQWTGVIKRWECVKDIRGQTEKRRGCKAKGAKEAVRNRWKFHKNIMGKRRDYVRYIMHSSLTLHAQMDRVPATGINHAVFFLLHIFQGFLLQIPSSLNA